MSSATPFWEKRDAAVRDVEAQLARLWTAATAAASTPMPDDGVLVTEKGSPHARTSVLNLIVTVPDPAAGDRVLDLLLSLGPRHPSRAIILQADPLAAGAPLDARIGTHCSDANGSGRICFEQVALTVRGEAAGHLDGIVAPLVIHDLPTEVWWPGDPPFADPIFHQLVEMGDRLVVNSAEFGDLLGGLKRLAAIRRRSGVGDLAWERLGPWQQITAQFFDAPRFRRYLPNLSRLRIQYAVPDPASPPAAPPPPSPEAGALLYAGWIATRLAWRRAHQPGGGADGGAAGRAAGRADGRADGGTHDRLRLVLEGRYEMVELLTEPVPTADLPPGELLSVRLRAFGEAGSAEFIIDRLGEVATIVTNADGMTALLRRMPLHPEPDAEVLRRQLILERRDLLYEDALRAAAILLGAAREAAA